MQSITYCTSLFIKHVSKHIIKRGFRSGRDMSPFMDPPKPFYTAELPDVVEVPVQTGAKHRGTIVWLHGLGDSSEGFRDLFEKTTRRELKGIKVLLPNAPIRPVTVNGGEEMRAWYDIVELGNRMDPSKEDRVGIAQSCNIIEDILNKESKIIPSNKIVLGGFSMGGAMSMYCGLQYPQKLAGIVSCSGYVLLHLLMNTQLPPSNANTPVIAFHGERDETVPWTFAREGYNQLTHRLGANISFTLERPAAHEITPSEFQQLLNWFNSVLPAEE